MLACPPDRLRVALADGKARAVHFGLNPDGQVVSRWQSNNDANASCPT